LDAYIFGCPLRANSGHFVFLIADWTARSNAGRGGKTFAQAVSDRMTFRVCEQKWMFTTNRGRSKGNRGRRPVDSRGIYRAIREPGDI
jgi:hypothetical protein